MSEDLQLHALLYCRFRRQLYVDYMRGAKLLAGAGTGNSTSRHTTWIPVLGDPECQAPDVCSNCMRCLGTTLGGRLRNYCYVCKSTHSSISAYEIQQLALIWNCSQDFVVFLLSNAISKAGRYYDNSPELKAAVSFRTDNTSQVSEEV